MTAVVSRYLGNDTGFNGLDAIEIDFPKIPSAVSMRSDEVTALCPWTNQPDFYTVEITYLPNQHICESKSLKLYFQSMRDWGISAEELSSRIAWRFADEIRPYGVTVTVIQKPRGGISINANTKLALDTIHSSEPFYVKMDGRGDVHTFFEARG